MRVDVDEEGECGGSRVAGERVLDGGGLSVLKYLGELSTEGSVNVTAFVVFLKLFGVLAEECLLVEGGCPRRDAG